MFVSATNRACVSIPIAGARASTTPSSATLSKPNCCACRSRKPAITALLKGHAIKTELPSTSVTVIRGSMRLMKRAQVVPANPPPTTTTRPAEPCDMAGNRQRSRSNSRRGGEQIAPADGIFHVPSVFPGGVPIRNCFDLRACETFSYTIHHSPAHLAGLERTYSCEVRIASFTRSQLCGWPHAPAGRCRSGICW